MRAKRRSRGIGVAWQTSLGSFLVAILEHDPEKWEPVFGKDHAQIKNLKRDCDSTKKAITL
jgi:hypothetical protein